MKKSFFITLLIFSMFTPSMSQARQKKMKTTFKEEINYLMFLPKEYVKTGKPSPMILFLHGSGERGNDLEKVKAWGPPAIVEKNPDYFAAIAPIFGGGNPLLVSRLKDIKKSNLNLKL